jgi:hypothetical protein
MKGEAHRQNIRRDDAAATTKDIGQRGCRNGSDMTEPALGWRNEKPRQKAGAQYAGGNMRYVSTTDRCSFTAWPLGASVN